MFGKYTLQQIISGKSADGLSLLEPFLREYAKLESISLETLQPSCQICLKKYYDTYILKHAKMENRSKYKLQKKYHGIQLAFGSSIYLTNANLTDNYAEKLISKYLDIAEKNEQEFNIDNFFTEYPENWEDAQYEEENEDLKLNLKELRAKYPNVKAGSIADFLERIEKQ